MTDKSQQVKEAAKRLRAIFDVLDELVGDFDPDISDDFTDEDVRVEHPLFWCCREVNRVLAEHPADDAEAFSLEWVQGVCNGQIYRDDVSTLLVCQVGRGIEIDENGGVFISHEEMRPVKTRGDVRRLCTALGIELNETTDSPQLGPDYELVRYTDDKKHAVVQQGDKEPEFIPADEWKRLQDATIQHE